MDGIREIDIERDDEGQITRMRAVFGPHYFIEITQVNGRVTVALGATHHGILADASAVGGELEGFVGELQALHPDRAF